MALKPLGYYCNNRVPFIEGIEAEYGSYLQKMSYELKLAMRMVFASLILLLERSNDELTVKQLSQQACAWALPYLDIEDNEHLTQMMNDAIHLDVGDMEGCLHGLTAIIQNSEGE